MLISEDYRQQSKALHAARLDYGANGHILAPDVVRIAKIVQARSILDYGAGKQTLREELGHLGFTGDVHAYDPAVSGIDDRPEPADLVACIDVLEHVEPECLEAVLWDLHELARRALYVSIHLGPAHKTLPDGRNAHLTQRPAEWWLERLFHRFTFETAGADRQHLGAHLTPRPDRIVALPTGWPG